MKQYVKENKILIIYCGILLLLFLFTQFVLQYLVQTNMILYYRYMMVGIILLLLGIPFVLFGGYFAFMLLKGTYEKIPILMMKRKKKFTKKGKKILKNDLFLTSFFGALMILGIIFSWGGLDYTVTAINDYAYLNNPKTIHLDYCYIESNVMRFSVERYWLYGIDDKKQECEFLLWKYPDVFYTEDNPSLKVYYLPHSKIIMKIS